MLASLQLLALSHSTTSSVLIAGRYNILHTDLLEYYSNVGGVKC